MIQRADYISSIKIRCTQILPSILTAPACSIMSASDQAKVIHADEDVKGAVDRVVAMEWKTDDLMSFYDKWATTYDEDLDRLPGGCRHPMLLAQAVSRFVADKQARILDVACGTGKVAFHLKRLGFSNIDALDGSDGMLNAARQQNLYCNYYLDFVDDSPIKSIEMGAYDAVVTVGSFTKGHLTAKCLKPLGLCARQGGLFILVMRKNVLEMPEFQDLEPTMMRLEQEGFWKQKHRSVDENYMGNDEGLTYVFEKL